jgi:hypothetical protein
VEVHSETTTNIYGGVEVQFHSFLISALDAVTGQLYTLAALYLGKKPRYPPNRRLGRLKTDPSGLERKKK